MQKPEIRRLPRMLVAGRDQFGYLTDSFQHVLHLRDSFAITYLGWSSGLPDIELERVEVKHFSGKRNSFSRYVAFIFRLLSEIRSGNFDLVYLSYFAGAGVVPLLAPRTTCALDIRSGYVRRSNVLRRVFNTLILLDSMMFRHVTIITDSLRRVLHISAKKSHVLPLGATVPEVAAKSFESMQLLYIGTLESRHIDRTVEGFARFFRECGKDTRCAYDIVGFGRPHDEDELRAAIAGCGCADAITYHGRVPYPELGPFLARNNIGIAFVPLVDYYDCQPPTKLFEYLLAGMAVLATSTSENARIMTEQSGVLIGDTAEDVYRGLLLLARNLRRYDSRAIRATVEGYTWDRIVGQNLKPYLLSILKNASDATGNNEDSVRIAV